MNGKPLPKQKDLGRKKKKSVSKLKKELDALFSQYIRRKYAKQDRVSCYTCDKCDDYRNMQCGHFASRVYLATRFDEDNCRVQCVGCNVFGGGKIAVFATRLTKECGEGTVEKLYKKAQELTKWGTKEYEEKIAHYKSILTTLE